MDEFVSTRHFREGLRPRGYGVKELYCAHHNDEVLKQL